MHAAARHAHLLQASTHDCWLQDQQKGNRKAEGIVTDALIAARAIPNRFVELIDSSGGVAHVTSMSEMSVQYHVTDAGKPTARCTRPQGLLHCICKHVVKVISLSQGCTDANIM